MITPCAALWNKCVPQAGPAASVQPAEASGIGCTTNGMRRIPWGPCPGCGLVLPASSLHSTTHVYVGVRQDTKSSRGAAASFVAPSTSSPSALPAVASATGVSPAARGMNRWGGGSVVRALLLDRASLIDKQQQGSSRHGAGRDASVPPDEVPVTQGECQQGLGREQLFRLGLPSLRRSCMMRSTFCMMPSTLLHDAFDAPHDAFDAPHDASIRRCCCYCRR